MKRLLLIMLTVILIDVRHEQQTIYFICFPTRSQQDRSFSTVPSRNGTTRNMFPHAWITLLHSNIRLVSAFSIVIEHQLVGRGVSMFVTLNPRF